MRIRTYHSHMQPIGILVPVRVWSLYIHPESKRPGGRGGHAGPVCTSMCSSVFAGIASLCWATSPYRFPTSWGAMLFFCCAVLWNAVLRHAMIYLWIGSPLSGDLVLCHAVLICYAKYSMLHQTTCSHLVGISMFCKAVIYYAVLHHRIGSVLGGAPVPCHAWICYAMLCYAMLHHYRFFPSWGSCSLLWCAIAMLCAGMRHHVIGPVFSAMLCCAMPLYALP